MQTPDDIKTELANLFIQQWVKEHKRNAMLKTSDPVELLVAKYISINTILNLKNQ
jgi:hypothetical protein